MSKKLVRYIVFVIILGMIFISIFTLYINKKRDDLIVRIKEETIHYLHDNNGLMSLLYDNVHQDLYYFHHSLQFEQYLADTTNNRALLEEYLVLMAHENKDYVQIRYIDATGMEQVRINNYETIDIVPNEELQDKSHREYFIETAVLEDGTMFISQLDYNIEHGVVVEPFEPVIRFATPIYSDSDEFLGIIIINYDGIAYLDILDTNLENYQNLLSTGIIDNNGYWTSSQNEELGYTYVNSEEDPNNVIFEMDHINGITFINETIVICQEFNFDNNIPIVVQASAGTIYLTGVFTEADIETLLSDDFLYHSWTKVTIALVFSIIITIAAEFVSAKTTENKRRQTLSYFSEYARNGLITTDKYNRVLTVNQYLVQLLGYDQLNLDVESTSLPYSAIQYTDKSQTKGLTWNMAADGTYILLSCRRLQIKDMLGRFNGSVLVYSTTPTLNPNLSEETTIKKYQFGPLASTIYNLPSLQTIVKGYYLMIDSVYPSEVREDAGIRNLLHIIQKMKQMFIVREVFIKSKQRFEVIVESTLDEEELIRTLLQAFEKWVPYDQQACDYVIGFSKFDVSNLARSVLEAYIANQIAFARESNIIAYSENLQDEFLRMEKINQLFKHGLTDLDFQVYYQPIVHSKTNQITYLEALIRLHHPDFGVLSPFEFLRYIEKHQLIQELSSIVIQHIIEDYGVFQQHELQPNISINLGSQDFDFNHVKEYIIAPILTSEISFNHFLFEVTETALLVDFEIVQVILKELRKLGAKIALDDFGTGYSSLSYLHRLQVDYLKIDKLFLGPGQNQSQIFETIISLGQSLKLPTIIEGVETKDQLVLIREHNVDYYQGYLVSKPAPIEKIIPIIQQLGIIQNCSKDSKKQMKKSLIVIE